MKIISLVIQVIVLILSIVLLGLISLSDQHRFFALSNETLNHLLNISFTVQLFLIISNMFLFKNK